MPKKRISAEESEKNEREGRFQDILAVTKLLSSSTAPEKLIDSVLAHLCQRLGKRVRCALLEGDELKLRFWAGKYSCPVGGLSVDKGSVVWDAVKKGRPVNLTESDQTQGYTHSLEEPVKIKSIIPLAYVDPITNRSRKKGLQRPFSGRIAHDFGLL